MIALVTGSAGLIGSEAVKFLTRKGFRIVGIDNNLREYFFGREASTDWNRRQLEKKYANQYVHHSIDIRNHDSLEQIFKKDRFDLIVHTAAQPSHDWAAKEPLTDFSVNALGTLNLLEHYRNYCPRATFIFTSTNKVYGDTPNRLPLIETASRYEIDPTHHFRDGIDESMSIDQSKHSLFGASKVAADILVQEYGRYFGLNTAVFRGGCLTGPNHSGAQLHGFLAYLVKCIASGKKYTIFGYQGKQVRDNIHSYDLVNMFWSYHQKPRPGEVYNAGGGRDSNVSMMEAIAKIEKLLNKKANYEYVDQPRAGDHIWYISNLAKFKQHYPEWRLVYSLDRLLEEICNAAVKSSSKSP
jgi:CDP-paratose 2-epimerase